MINLLMESHDSYENDKFVNQRRRGVVLEKKIKKEHFRWFAVSICPPGQVLAGPDMSEVRVLVQFGTFQVPKLYFDEMT